MPMPQPVNDHQPCTASRAGLRTVRIERQAMEQLEQAMASPAFGLAFDRAAALIAGSSGRIVVSGMGKSGLVGRRLAATLASTGTPSFFIHPAEASHGDLGMIDRGDVVLALSWSGETAELSDIISYSRRFAIPLIAVTAAPNSPLARDSDIVLLLPKVEEACPNRLAPTSSAMLQSAIGDALAVALIELRGFSAEHFRVLHPKGRLGAILMRVGDLMSTGNDVPSVGEDVTILAAMLEMSLKRFGVTGVVDAGRRLVGAFSDGDLRRSLTETNVDAPVSRHMSKRPLTVDRDRLVSEALAMMNASNITQLFVCEDGELIGILHLHDILRAGVA